ncbi:hypothetical protein U1Q18_015045, partial [Sarracenia purpurea var. burkii]
LPFGPTPTPGRHRSKPEGCESQGQEAQSSNPPRTGISEASDELDAEKSSDVQIEGQSLVPPTPAGDVAVDAEEANSVLNRTKERKLKQNVKTHREGFLLSDPRIPIS